MELIFQSRNTTWILFSSKEVLQVVIGQEKKLIIDTIYASPNNQELLDTWDKKNIIACIFFSKSISQRKLKNTH